MQCQSVEKMTKTFANDQKQCQLHWQWQFLSTTKVPMDSDVSNMLDIRDIY